MIEDVFERNLNALIKDRNFINKRDTKQGDN